MGDATALTPHDAEDIAEILRLLRKTAVLGQALLDQLHARAVEPFRSDTLFISVGPKLGSPRLESMLLGHEVEWFSAHERIRLEAETLRPFRAAAAALFARACANPLQLWLSLRISAAAAPALELALAKGLDLTAVKAARRWRVDDDCDLACILAHLLAIERAEAATARRRFDVTVVPRRAEAITARRRFDATAAPRSVFHPYAGSAATARATVGAVLAWLRTGDPRQTPGARILSCQERPMIEMLQIRLDGYSALYDGQDWLVVGFSRWVRYHAVQTARAKMTDLGFPPPPEGSDPMPCLTQDRFFREHAVDRELQESFHQPHSAHELIRIASRPEVELLVVDGVVRKDTRTVQVTIQQA